MNLLQWKKCKFSFLINLVICCFISQQLWVIQASDQPDTGTDLESTQASDQPDTGADLESTLASDHPDTDKDLESTLAALTLEAAEPKSLTDDFESVLLSPILSREHGLLKPLPKTKYFESQLGINSHTQEWKIESLPANNLILYLQMFSSSLEDVCESFHKIATKKPPTKTRCTSSSGVFSSIIPALQQSVGLSTAANEDKDIIYFPNQTGQNLLKHLFYSKYTGIIKDFTTKFHSFIWHTEKSMGLFGGWSIIAIYNKPIGSSKATYAGPLVLPVSAPKATQDVTTETIVDEPELIEDELAQRLCEAPKTLRLKDLLDSSQPKLIESSQGTSSDLDISLGSKGTE